MNPDKFNYISSDGLLNINTLSPNKQFFYKVKKVVELNKSAFGCKVSFYDYNDYLIYYRSNVFAYEIHDKYVIKAASQTLKLDRSSIAQFHGIDVVKWSIQGNVVYILEFLNKDETQIFDSVFINLKEQYCYRINEIENKFSLIDSLNLADRTFDENIVLQKLGKNNFRKEELIKDDPHPTSFFGEVLRSDRWYP